MAESANKQQREQEALAQDRVLRAGDGDNLTIVHDVGVMSAKVREWVAALEAGRARREKSSEGLFLMNRLRQVCQLWARQMGWVKKIKADLVEEPYQISLYVVPKSPSDVDVTARRMVAVLALAVGHAYDIRCDGRLSYSEPHAGYLMFGPDDA